jgi:hypothetical protein
MKKICFICIIALIGFSACDDDDNEVWTRSEYLVANGPWYLDQAIVSANVQGQQFHGNIAQYLPVCIEDNSVSFQPDGSILINESLVKCNEQDPQEIRTDINWTLSDYDTKLMAMIPGLTENIQFQVLELDGRRLRVRWSDTYMNEPATFEALFTHYQ